MVDFYDPDIIGITETIYCIDGFKSPYVKTELILNMVEVVVWCLFIT